MTLTSEKQLTHFHLVRCLKKLQTRRDKSKCSISSSAGGWIVDNFPLTREHWTVLIDRGLAPDEVVFLKDSSEGMTFLLKRWYHLNKEEVDMKAKLRKEEEEREKARILEEAR